jgi:hypothetical protein
MKAIYFSPLYLFVGIMILTIVFSFIRAIYKTLRGV